MDRVGIIEWKASSVFSDRDEVLLHPINSKNSFIIKSYIRLNCFEKVERGDLTC